VAGGGAPGAGASEASFEAGERERSGRVAWAVVLVRRVGRGFRGELGEADVTESAVEIMEEFPRFGVGDAWGPWVDQACGLIVGLVAERDEIESEGEVVLFETDVGGGGAGLSVGEERAGVRVGGGAEEGGEGGGAGRWLFEGVKIWRECADAAALGEGVDGGGVGELKRGAAASFFER